MVLYIFWLKLHNAWKFIVRNDSKININKDMLWNNEKVGEIAVDLMKKRVNI